MKAELKKAVKQEMTERTEEPKGKESKMDKKLDKLFGKSTPAPKEKKPALKGKPSTKKKGK